VGSRAAANMGYTTMRGAVLRMTVLCKVEHLCFVLKFGGNNPALRVAQNRCASCFGDSANFKLSCFDKGDKQSKNGEAENRPE